MIDRRHVDQVPAGEGDVGGDPRPLGAEGFLGDLHQQLFPFVEEFLDGGEDRAFLAAVGGAGMLGLAVDKLFDRLHLVEDVGDVEKGRLLQADIDEGRLHPRQDANDLPLIDVADNPPFPVALDVEFGDVAVLDEGDAGFVGGGIDDQFLGHNVLSVSAKGYINENVKINSGAARP